MLSSGSNRFVVDTAGKVMRLPKKMKKVQKAGGLALWLCLFALNAFYVHGSFSKYLSEPIIVDMSARRIMASDRLQITFGSCSVPIDPFFPDFFAFFYAIFNF